MKQSGATKDDAVKVNDTFALCGVIVRLMAAPPTPKGQGKRIARRAAPWCKGSNILAGCGCCKKVMDPPKRAEPTGRTEIVPGQLSACG